MLLTKNYFGETPPDISLVTYYPSFNKKVKRLLKMGHFVAYPVNLSRYSCHILLICCKTMRTCVHS